MSCTDSNFLVPTRSKRNAWKSTSCFHAGKDNPEFLSSLNEEELKHQFPKFDSKLIEQVSVLLQNVGTPISTGGGLTWQVEVQNYLLRNPTFTRDLVLLFNNPLKKEEKSIFVLTTLRHYLKLLKFLRAMSKTWKESKAVKQGRSEKGRPKPKMEPYKKGTKNKKEIYWLLASYHII